MGESRTDTLPEALYAHNIEAKAEAGMGLDEGGSIEIQFLPEVSRGWVPGWTALVLNPLTSCPGC